MADIKVRVGQQNTVKVISSLSGSAGGRAVTAENVIGGIASVRQLHVSGISTFVGVSTFNNDVYVGGNLYIKNDLTLDEVVSRNSLVTGISTISGGLYYGQYYTNGMPYFNSTGLLVSTQSPQNGIDYTNYIMSTDNSGIPAWSSSIDGGTY